MGNNNLEETNDSELIEWIKSIVIAIVIAVFIKTFIFNTTIVSGNSMNPTLNGRDRLFANKIPLYFEKINRGDIVLFDAPDDDKKKYIKRVIALEGDTVHIDNGKVYLNGEELHEPYIHQDAYTETYDINNWIVGKDEVFVLGDNRYPGESKDSRYFGCIKRDTLEGIAQFRFYPFGQNFGVLK